MSQKKLIVVDISSFIFRAFYAVRPMHKPDGTPVNAAYGVMTMLMKLINSYKPTHLVLARDLPGGSFRNEKYELYKANRGEPPEELVPQFSIIETLIEKMQMPAIAIKNYEADDIIGSVVTQFEKDFDEIYIASGDKDLMQFVNDKVKMLDTMKDKIYGKKEVFEKMGVHPEQIVDYLSLLGDSSDNIPGVKGIGAKGAATLLAQFPTLDELIENIDEIANKRARTALEKDIEGAHISKELVQIVTNLDLGYKAEELKFTLDPHDDFLEYLDELNFKSIRNKIQNSNSGSSNSYNSVQVNYDVVKDEKKYNEIISHLEGEDQVFIESFYAKEQTYHDDMPFVLGISSAEKTYVVYLNEIKPYADFIRDLSDIEDITIITDNTKSFYYHAKKNDIDLDNELFDLTQAHFILDPDKKHDLASICMETMNEFALSKKEMLKESLEAPESVRKFEFAMAKRSYCGLRSYPWLLKELAKKKLLNIYSEVDAPVNEILAKMEVEGIHLDTNFYEKVKKEFEEQINEIETKVEEVAGEKINLKSPKQVGALLFETLELPVIKKTKTGYSTDASVLETLADMDESEIPALIIKHREIGKLLSTYVNTLPELIDDNSVIRTHFNQANAATGRLSSDHPNLQNIPVKTENGRMLRKGFVAKKGYQFIGADYSQVELRILAHLSKDKVMVNAFNNDEDIHSQTASQVFDIDFEDVTSEQRSYAKAINFGLMYGQSSFGLSQMLKISPKEAKEYITQYFERFSSVKVYLDSLKEECEENGYTSTISGRKRVIKDISSTNRQVKAMAERMAINTPIQGTAADIIKMAMIDIDHKLTSNNLETKMILQVHDELIFEAPDNEVEKVQSIIKESMESVMDLSIPLRVDVNVGNNWFELK
ncbi:MAG: DNA polymerase I [Bacteriovoracaceae bacterium]|jgi:DNA polymerase-1|nr:DNA polymerase I [Bacteriovoracaceae bacterium]